MTNTYLDGSIFLLRELLYELSKKEGERYIKGRNCPVTG